jgi:hypothetical protein
MYSDSQLKQEHKLMTDDGIYNKQNKAHKRRLLVCAGNEIQSKCPMQNTLKDTERVNNKNRN